ncbi:PREDICTED: LOC18786833 [Prunus dulcis]|uniref:PREDICTED: LOC18786833 n=1 Tax=Prunus dulcis TaxID=3755 RepID=A0A5E4GJ35_PRUDU|nr:uncharacterized protein LOC117619649 [Prunus dulcis]XP_034225879.1 uncharacterized protein LOC117635651 [Prunus dulcis]VVA23684.1 PREDICTED: LOC18786833 [Prunus dulcis]VVA39804.1 PREDICTED: LOC18786833 [Prunus dulcis]
MWSPSPIAPSICPNLADTLLKQLRYHPFAPCPEMNHDLVAGNPVARAPKPLAAVFGPKSKTSDPVDRASEPLAPAFGPESKTGDPVDCSAKTTRYYMVLLTAGDKALSPESIRVMDVTDPIPKGCMIKARAFCSGVAFNFNFSAADKFDFMKLCVISSDDEFGGDEGRTIIDLDRVSNSEMADPNIIHSLASSAAMKALVSSAKEINLAEFVGRVCDYVATKFGEEKKSEYLKMLTSSGLGSLDAVEIWHMLTLQDRVMEAVMESFRIGLFMKMPITIDMPMPPTASMTHPTPWASGWKVGCSSAKGLKPRPCIPDLNQVAVDLLEEEEETDKSSVGEVEGRNAKKRKAKEAAGKEAQADEVPKTAD